MLERNTLIITVYRIHKSCMFMFFFFFKFIDVINQEPGSDSALFKQIWQDYTDS